MHRKPCLIPLLLADLPVLYKEELFFSCHSFETDNMSHFMRKSAFRVVRPGKTLAALLPTEASYRLGIYDIEIRYYNI